MTQRHPITARELERIRLATGEWIARNSMRGSGITYAEQTRRLFENYAAGVSAYDPGSGSTSSSAISDPTGNAATRDEPQTDAWQRQNSEAWRRLHKTIQELDRLAEVAHRQRPRKDRTGIDSSDRICANPHCKETIGDNEIVRRGRCEPCADFFDRRANDAGPKVINDRRRARGLRAIERVAT